ncbi:hypothetical protein MTR67_014507 [Solanum verrucosum]|uniref:Reverse transcriptase domain-containing protein n=1 Tax=Solanum verrucosum TaxID=315347 RepID=A0AAF0QE12_SOLVR|nr:hypothetical protein MTR67_014507 [Solanum verrucosum]
MIQGHNEEQCFVVHPELYPKEKTGQVERKENDRTEKNPIARRTAVEDATKVGNIQQPNREEDTPGVQMSANKDKRSKFQDGIIDTEQAEENSHAEKKNIAKSGDIVDSSPGRKMGEYVIERGNDEVVSTKYNNEENNYEKEKDGTDCVSRDVLEQGLNSENENHRDEVESVIRRGPDLIDDDDDVLQQRKDLEEDEELEYNIQQISKAGDLSPRHTNSLKNRELEELARSQQCPWVVGGDFNVILNEEEKLGGLAFTQNEALEFASCINACALTEVRTSGSKYTWWNGRIEEDCIFKRLDRILVNQEFMDLFPTSEVHYLIRQGSDHAPLHMTSSSREDVFIKPFRFLNFWSKHKHFKQVVADNWSVDFVGNPFIEFHAKMKRVKKALSMWSKSAYGNVFQQIATIEDMIRVKEIQLEIQPSASNRAELSKVEADLKKYLQVEEDFWRQKAGMKWFSDGDRNTKIFHSYVKGKRKKLHIDEIVTDQEITLQTNEQIGLAAVGFFEEQFRAEMLETDYAMIDHIPKSISDDENDSMSRLPDQDEEIIGDDATKLVRAFFCGQELTKFVTHTNIVLLPKKESVRSFSDLRPISLSNVLNKIISRVIHERILLVLPKIISPTQSGFVKGRSITENVLLAQEIIRDMNMRNKNVNVVVKLDMAKAYDRVSWIFLTKGTWSFQIVERTEAGRSSIPTLFIIAAEVLARGLNSLHGDVDFKGYGLPKWSPKINHLSYADDTILFCSGERRSVIKMMQVLKEYESTSGQMINKSKSCFYLHEKTPLIVAIRLRRLTGIRQGNFPFLYLGCPVFYGRSNSGYFEDLIRKVAKRIFPWHNKFLSFGGKQVLVNHVLQSLPIYLLSAMNPTKKVMEQIHQIFAKFFWGNIEGVKGKHWVAWRDMCLPNEEGGIGFRQIQDINKALFAKLWWNFRVSINSLWAEYMWNKYCKKMHPLIVNSSGASQVWKKMIKIRKEVEHDIWWQIKAGNSSFWFDDWTRQGALYFTEGELAQDEELKVKDFIINDEWNEDKLRSVISEEMVQHITMNIRPILKEGSTDKAWWMHSTKGDFTVKSAYNNMRRKLSVNEWSNYMWVKGLPFKIGFFLWRVWRGRIATDDNLKRMRIQVVSKCYCCEEGQLETMSHLLLTAPIAQKLWKQFASCVGLSVTENLKQTIYRWWEHKMSHKLDQILKAVPAIIIHRYSGSSTGDSLTHPGVRVSYGRGTGTGRAGEFCFTTSNSENSGGQQEGRVQKKKKLEDEILFRIPGDFWERANRRSGLIHPSLGATWLHPTAPRTKQQLKSRKSCTRSYQPEEEDVGILLSVYRRCCCEDVAVASVNSLLRVLA